jgi:hypothetical protein
MRGPVALVRCGASIYDDRFSGIPTVRGSLQANVFYWQSARRQGGNSCRTIRPRSSWEIQQPLKFSPTIGSDR